MSIEKIEAHLSAISELVENMQCPKFAESKVISIDQCGQVLTSSSATISVTDPNPIAGRLYDLWINQVDQGPSQTSTSWNITGLPTDGSTILKQVYTSDDSGVSFTLAAECTCTAVTISENIELALDIPSSNVNTVTDSTWEAMTDDAHVFFTGNQNLVSVVQDGSDSWLRIEHPAGQATDLCEGASISDRDEYSLKQRIRFPINWTHGTPPTDGGKIGFGLSGGSYVNNGINVIVSGGTTAQSGWSLRPGFDGDELILYGYYANRPGMNYPNTPPSQLFGHFIYTGITITPGQEYLFELKTKLNSPGNTDGEIRVFVDGVQRVYLQNIIFMLGQPEHNRLFFCSNHGGSGSAYAPQTDTYVDYTDVVLSY